MSKIRLILSDDHPLIRVGIRSSLISEVDFEIVGEASDGTMVQDLCVQYHPDILLLDLAMPGPSFKEIIQNLRETCPETKVLVLTAYDEEAYVRGLISLGVKGYVLKDEGPDILIHAIRTIHSGGSWFSQRVIEKMTNLLSTEDKPSANPALSQREKEVFVYLGEGMSNEQIAENLNISSRTVRFHVENLYEKLEVHNRAEAIVKGIRLGLIKG